MDRRHLLRLLASGLLGSTLDVDRLLWVPGAKRIFLSPTVLYDRELGITIRFIREYDINDVRRPQFHMNRPYDVAVMASDVDRTALETSLMCG